MPSLRITCSILAVLSAAHELYVPAGTPSTESGDAWCGPRCVHFVLQLSGQQLEFSDVLREDIWDPERRESSLHAMQTALAKYGLRWDVQHVKDRSTWLSGLRHPSIVHLTRDGSDVGHFVVVVESRDGFVTLWDGTSGLATLPCTALSQKMSGYVLAPAGERRVHTSLLMGSVFVGSALLIGLFQGGVSLRKHVSVRSRKE